MTTPKRVHTKVIATCGTAMEVNLFLTKDDSDNTCVLVQAWHWFEQKWHYQYEYFNFDYVSCCERFIIDYTDLTAQIWVNEFQFTK